MRKIRMIITSVIVLSIVGSAFAFKAKKALFCVVLHSEGHTNCTTYITSTSLKVVPIGGTQYNIYWGWDGDGINCTAPNNGHCTTVARLNLD